MARTHETFGDGTFHAPDPPESWPRLRRAAQRTIAPVESFLRIEAASGVVLLVVAVVALAWANSPWFASYQAILHTPIALRVGGWTFEHDVHFWINDGLMTIFFFVVGLEIRREIHRGELSDLRRATLPLAAALGGMVAPALIYLSLNLGRPSASGWGVPMATDIAFAVGVLALLGRRVPSAVRILLLALAVIDDVGAIVVIALFYSSGLAAIGFVIIGAGVAATVAMQAVGVRSPWLYVPPGVVVWIGALQAGIHPTLTGVILGLMTPVRAWFGTDRFLERAERYVRAVREKAGDDEREILPYLDALSEARREAVSPVERLQHALHGWVAFGVMPIFALANAGVTLGAASLAGDGSLVFFGVVLGLFVGKPVGVLALSWLATKAGIAALPAGVHWAHVGLVGIVAGIGFTMALFIALLALDSPELLETAKLAILSASALAGVTGLAVGRFLLSASPEASDERSNDLLRA